MIYSTLPLRVSILLLRLFGIVNQHNARNGALRILQLFANGFAVTEALITLFFISKVSWEDVLLDCSYASFHIHSMILYLWRLTNIKASLIKASKTRFHFNVLVALLLLLNVGLAVSTVEYILSAPDYGTLFDSNWWTMYFLIGQLTYIDVQLQRGVIYIELAVVLKDLADKIENLVSLAARKGLDSTCRKIESLCGSFSTKFAFPLTVIHSAYFAQVVLELPAQATKLQCDSYYVRYFYLYTTKHVLEYLLVISAGNAVACGTARLRRRVRHADEHHCSSLRDTQLFMRTQIGIRFGFGNLLSWKTCCCFHGVLWSFALTAFQNAIAYGEGSGCDI